MKKKPWKFKNKKKLWKWPVNWPFSELFFFFLSPTLNLKNKRKSINKKSGLMNPFLSFHTNCCSLTFLLNGIHVGSCYCKHLFIYYMQPIQTALSGVFASMIEVVLIVFVYMQQTQKTDNFRTKFLAHRILPMLSYSGRQVTPSCEIAS